MFNQTVVRKAVIRYLTIVIDLSSASLKQDLRPNRAIVIKDLLSKFIHSFADQNPLSALSVIVSFKEGSKLLSDFIESPTDHVSIVLAILLNIAYELGNQNLPIL